MLKPFDPRFLVVSLEPPLRPRSTPPPLRVRESLPGDPKLAREVGDLLGDFSEQTGAHFG